MRYSDSNPFSKRVDLKMSLSPAKQQNSCRGEGETGANTKWCGERAALLLGRTFLSFRKFLQLEGNEHFMGIGRK